MVLSFLPRLLAAALPLPSLCNLKPSHQYIVMQFKFSHCFAIQPQDPRKCLTLPNILNKYSKYSAIFSDHPHFLFVSSPQLGNMSCYERQIVLLPRSLEFAWIRSPSKSGSFNLPINLCDADILPIVSSKLIGAPRQYTSTPDNRSGTLDFKIQTDSQATLMIMSFCIEFFISSHLLG